MCGTYNKVYYTQAATLLRLRFNIAGPVIPLFHGVRVEIGRVRRNAVLVFGFIVRNRPPAARLRGVLEILRHRELTQSASCQASETWDKNSHSDRSSS